LRALVALVPGTRRALAARAPALEGNADMKATTMQMRSPEESDDERLASGRTRGCVLVVDDEPGVRRALARQLRSLGYRALEASSGRQALAVLAAERVHVVFTDLSMPDMDGIQLMNAIRAENTFMPVVFTTGHPSIDSAARAVELGAFRYLVKPVAHDALRGCIDAALVDARTRADSRASADADLEVRFVRALAGLHMHLQPIVSTETHTTIAFEALMRSDEPTLPNPCAVLDAATQLGALHVLGRRIRRLSAKVIEESPSDMRFFINLHAADLVDPDLYDEDSPLSRHAHRVVLEITERASLEAIPDIAIRLAQLRAMRYRIAIDDLGAGYAALSYFASLQPDLIKVDMSLIRGIDADPVRQRIVLALVALANAFGMEVVAEGVETPEERDTSARLGCHYVQGYALARPGKPFPEACWS
jgi:EAL domain-containing protein (putative c-di-GMP-specific phosphodiesterase class I)